MDAAEPEATTGSAPTGSAPTGSAPPAGRWYVVRSGEVLTVGPATLPVVGSAAALPEQGAVASWLAAAPTDTPMMAISTGCWAVGVPPATEAPDGGCWEQLRRLGAALQEDEWALAGRAVQLVEWARTSRFCGRCGAANGPSPGERGMRCPSCGLVAYPRLAPAVIVLVRRGERALLGRNARYERPTFSTLAGFVEPGETLEGAVRREVLEEAGVVVGPMRYFGSQPWPFPNSLMVGFVAEWESGEIEVDGEEIGEAGWFAPGELPPLPPRLSIARRLIDAWLEELGAPS